MAKNTRKTVDESTSIVAPSVRVFNDWTPARLKSAERAAEYGDLSQAVGVCDWLWSDDRVAGTLGGRCDALLGLTASFEPSGDRRRSNRAVKALEAGEDFWAGYPEAELRQLQGWGLLLGIAPGKHAWSERADHGGRLLPFPQFYHPGTLRYDAKARRWTVRDSLNVEHVVVAGDGEWILHTPFGAQRPWASGMWRSMARWVLVKHYAILDWARHGEKAATLVATTDIETTQKQRKELAADLQSSGSDRVVALAAGFDLKLIEISANTRQIYEAQIQAADNAIAILVRGGNLTTNVNEGSRAAAETQAKHGDEPKLRYDAEALSTTLHDQSLVWWAEFNFGDSALAPWPVWPVEPEEDKGARATTIKTLGEGLTALDKLGYEFDDKALFEDFGLSFLKPRLPLEQRPKPAVPVAPGAPLPEDPKAPKPKQQQRGGFSAQLASGALASENPGFVAGQLFVDGIVDSATAAATAALAPDMLAIAAAVEASTSYEDLRDRLRTLYADMSGEDLSELMYRAMLLSEIAGRRAVTQDA